METKLAEQTQYQRSMHIYRKRGCQWIKLWWSIWWENTPLGQKEYLQNVQINSLIWFSDMNDD